LTIRVQSKTLPTRERFAVQWIRWTGRGISFRETVTCVPNRIGRWVFANSTRSVAAAIKNDHPIGWSFFIAADVLIPTGAQRPFDGTRGKRAIFLCNEVDTRPRPRRGSARSRRNILVQRAALFLIGLLRDGPVDGMFDLQWRLRRDILIPVVQIAGQIPVCGEHEKAFAASDALPPVRLYENEDRRYGNERCFYDHPA
jgi:hypothetical protein